MENIAITNRRIFLEIANETYDKMVASQEAGRIPKNDGTGGQILSHDPNSVSFKQAIISIVFTGMWIEALTHALIIKNSGLEKFKELDFKSYEERLKHLGVLDEELLQKVAALRITRKELVHEKSFIAGGSFKVAQQEANLAHEVRSALINLLGH